jgi:hypothetical protein
VVLGSFFVTELVFGAPTWVLLGLLPAAIAALGVRGTYVGPGLLWLSVLLLTITALAFIGPVPGAILMLIAGISDARHRTREPSLTGGRA